MVKKNSDQKNSFDLDLDPSDQDLLESEFFEQNLESEILVDDTDDKDLAVDELETEIKTKDK